MATRRCLLVFVLLALAPRCEGIEIEVRLNVSMLKMHPGLATRNSQESIIDTAIDGDPGNNVHFGDGWPQCVTSLPTSGVAHWLAIDLKGVFFISEVNATFRYNSAQNAGVFVGNNPSVTDGRYEYRCGDRLPTSNVLRAPHWYSFACQPARWVSHVSIQRTGYEYIQICEVEVYYKQNTTVGVSISLTPTPQTVFVGEPLLCRTSLVSSNAKDLLQLQWLFPNGSAVSQQSNDSVTQQYNDNSVGLSFNSVTALQGSYSCNYTLNGEQRSQTVSVSAFDCGWSEWSSCSESCGKGTRKRQHRNSVTQRSESGCKPPTEQCFNTTCGKLNLTKIGASAAQGPENQSPTSMSASLAIDGHIVTDNSKRLIKNQCAASQSSSSVRTWLRIDLQNVYLINEVIVTFFGSTGRNALIRVGSNTSNDGNDNLLCGTVEDYTDFANSVNVQRTVQCNERLWGRYVNVQRQIAQNLEICEVEIYTELDVDILYNESNVTTVYVDEGGDLPGAIACGVSPDTTGYNDALKLNWRRADGTPIPIQTSPTSTISQSSNNQQNLYVKNVSIDEEGWYVCEYTMPKGNQTNTMSVEILVNVDCGWSEWSDCSSTCGVGNRSRSADSPAQRHRGRECKGASVESCSDLPPCPPTISNFTTAKQIDKGGSLELRCEALIPNLQNVNQTVDFQWAKYGQDDKETIIPIPDNDERVVTASHRDPNRLHFFYGTLRINPLSQLDSGSYTCRINSSIGTSSYTTDTVSVNVKFAPENVTLHQPLVAVKGTSATFTCTADGNPTPTYTWLKDGERVASKQTFSIGIVSYASAGEYVCVANNTIEAGWKTGRKSATVKVEGPPENCTILNADGHNSSSLKLDVKCYNGNSPITGYLLRFRKTSSSPWETRTIIANNGNTQVVILSDLEANTQYEVQVKAKNKHGYETGSDSFSVMTRATTEELKQDDSQSPIGAIAGAVAAIAILVILVIVVVIIIRRRRQSPDKLTDPPRNEHIDLETVKPVVDYAAPDEVDTPNYATAVPNSSELLSITAYEGTTALLPSDVIGDRQATIQWSKKEKQLLGEDPRFLVARDGALLIGSVQASDAGTYVCSAGSEMAGDKQRVKLTVKRQHDALRKPNPWQNPNAPVVPMGQSMQGMNSGRHAVPTDKFADYVAAMHDNNSVGFSNEFKLIDSVGKELPAAAFEANKEVNRYKNIPTYDHSRVVLSCLSESESDYIAAAYVDGFYKPKKYIAAQGPLKHTCVDFWRMIWAEDIPTIVMLTHLQEGIKIKCHQYWPSTDGDSEIFAPFIVTLRKTDVYADYTVRTLIVALGEQKRTVYQYHFTAWPDHDVPKFATGLLGFIGRVNRDHAQDRGPVAVHCSAGVGRTGTYMVIDTMLDRADDGQPIDIYSCVTSLRTRRAQMVQTQVQYMFIHDAVMEGVICGDTKIPVHNIHSAVAKMSKKDPRSEMTGFQLHFKVLQASGPHPDKQSCKAGLQPAVKTKNRYKDIVPFDRSRVILKTLEDSTDEYVNTAAGADYINASFLDGYRRRDAFIVTQAPLKQTVTDFWKMIWEQNCYSIVMLTPLEEEGKEMCHQYWPSSGSAQYGSIAVQMKDETERTDYVVREMIVTKDSHTKRIVTQFHYTDWPENDSPHNPAELLSMTDQLQKWQQATGDSVITIHCNNGVGRSGAFCGLFTLIEITKMESVIDFFHKVKAMRIQRPGMVQTVDQYVFMYEAILSYLDSFQTYANFK